MATANVPAFIKKDLALPEEARQGLGNENVSAEDLALPRIKLLQALSPEVDEDNDKYIEGAKPGMFVNTVTGALYNSMFVVPVYYKRIYSVFRKRELGGNKVGEFDTEREALDYLEHEGLNPDEHEITDTRRHILAILNEKGEVTDQAIYDMQSTAATISNQWNTMIKQLGVDRFATVWNLHSIKRKNTKGSWYVPAVEHVGFVDGDLYKRFKEMYLSFAGVQEQ